MFFAISITMDEKKLRFKRKTYEPNRLSSKIVEKLHFLIDSFFTFIKNYKKFSFKRSFLFS